MSHYGTVSGYKAYHLARDNDIPASSDPDIASALLVASEWLDATYRNLFAGRRAEGLSQPREWPRIGGVDVYGSAIPSTGYPELVANATYEAAWRQIARPGSLTRDFTPGAYKRVAVDGAVSVEFAGFNSASDVQTQIAIIGQILEPILTGSGNFAPMTSSAVRVR